MLSIGHGEGSSCEVVMHRIERISISRVGLGPAFSLTARATA